MAEHPDPGGDPAVELQRLRQEVASQRVKLELAREGVARLEAILASASDVAIITIDPGGLVTSWNPGATNLLGWDEAEALGMDGRLLFTPEDRERHAAEAETETALAEGRAADERWHMRKDGSRFRASGVMTPLRGGPEPGFLKVMRDVTAQRTAEAAASEGEARLRLITDHVPVQIGYLDREQRYRFANRPFADFLRTPPELLLGRTVREQVGEQTYVRLRPWFLAALAGETVSFEDEEPDKHGPGLSGWTEETYVPHLAPDGTVEGVYVLAVDITGRKRAEAALRASEERFRQFAEATDDVLWVVDAVSGRLEYLSPAFETVWGEPRDAVMRDLGRWAELVHPGDRERARHALDAALGGERTEIEYRIVRPSDGAVRWVRDAGFPIRGPNGRMRRVGGLARDVTARRDADERQTLLLRELSHRVKNTLTLILSMARQTGLRADGVADFMGTFEGRIEALAAAHELLTESGWRSTSLTALLEAALAAHDERRIPVRGRVGDLPLPPDTAQDLVLIVHELATNAAKHGALSVPGGTVTVDGRASEEGLLLCWREAGGPPVCQAGRARLRHHAARAGGGAPARG